MYLKSLIVFHLSWFIFFSAQAQMCIQHLSASSVRAQQSFISKNEIFNSYFQGAINSKFIGLAVKDSMGQEHMVLGPIIGSGHRLLLEKAIDIAFSKQTEILEILWAGEIHLRPEKQRIAVLEINETAGLNAELKSGYLPQYKNSSSVVNAVQVLNKNSLFHINSQTKVRKFDLADSHILEYVSTKDFRHTLGNQFNVMSYVELVQNGFRMNGMLNELEVSGLVNNMHTIIGFVKVFNQEVRPKISTEHQDNLRSLLEVEPLLLQIKNEADFQSFVLERPQLFPFLKSAHQLFQGSATMDFIIDISSI